MADRWYCKEEQLLKDIRKREYPENIAAVWYIGQMGIVLKWKKMVIYIDPVLNDLTNPDGSTRRNYPAPFDGGEAGADVVVCTHAHADHMNPDTLIPMYHHNPEMGIIVPNPETRRLIRAGISEEHLIGAREAQVISLAENAAVIPIAAAHDVYRTDDQGDHYSLGYILELGDMRIYHAGDTLVTEKLVEDLKKYAPFTAAFLPVNGVDIERSRRGVIGNMDCRDAAWLSEECNLGLTMPLHCDMIQGNTENPLVFAHYIETFHPRCRYQIPRLGERILLEAP